MASLATNPSTKKFVDDKPSAGQVRGSEICAIRLVESHKDIFSQPEIERKFKVPFVRAGGLNIADAKPIPPPTTTTRGRDSVSHNDGFDNRA